MKNPSTKGPTGYFSLFLAADSCTWPLFRIFLLNFSLLLLNSLVEVVIFDDEEETAPRAIKLISESIVSELCVAPINQDGHRQHAAAKTGSFPHRKEMMIQLWRQSALQLIGWRVPGQRAQGGKGGLVTWRTLRERGLGEVQRPPKVTPRNLRLFAAAFTNLYILSPTRLKDFRSKYCAKKTCCNPQADSRLTVNLLR
eukprot:TRINITY_DN376_c2_g1_i1.p1 TRINITY_DN376_c2_g1~~TRINITY_DN376_c2_g1_i1.p1  ORF type:complete len:198 (+),score=5.00 TRINITY_DN376_c2_g1_i1:315-908(+)